MADDKTKPPPPPPGSPTRIQINIDENVAQGIYSNMVVLNHTENEFVVDFAYLQPASPSARVRARLIVSPRHAKRLLAALQKNVEKYEERFGPITPSTDGSDETMH